MFSTLFTLCASVQPSHCELLSLLLDPCIGFLRNFRTSVEQVTFATIHDCNSNPSSCAHRQTTVVCVQALGHLEEIDSPIVANLNAQSFARLRLDTLHSGCAEREMHIARNPLPVCHALEPRCPFTPSTPNLIQSDSRTATLK